MCWKSVSSQEVSKVDYVQEVAECSLSFCNALERSCCSTAGPAPLTAAEFFPDMRWRWGQYTFLQGEDKATVDAYSSSVWE